MLDVLFAQLFRAVDRIRNQLEVADEGLRRHLSEELDGLERFGETLLDRWLLLDERIQELRQTYDLPRDTSPGMTLHLSHEPPGVPASDFTVWFVPASGQGATSHLEDIALGAPDPVLVTFRKGLGYLDLDMHEDAARAFAAVVDAADSLLARVYLAAALAARGNTAHALGHLGALRARTQDPLLISAADEIEAWIHAKAGRFDAAAHCLEAVVRRTPMYGDAWFNLGLCYLQLGNLPAAEHAVARALELNGEDGEATALLAFIHLERGDAVAACRVCSEGMRRHPGHVGIATAYVLALADTGNLSHALSHCRRICEQHPDRLDLFRLWVRLSLRAGRLEEARARIKKQVALRRAGATEWLTLAVIELLDGDCKRAEDAVAQALQHHADATIAALVLGAIYVATGQAEDAEAYLLHALRDPRRTVKRMSLYQLGKLALDRDQPDAAERYLKAAWVLGPPNPAIASLLGRTLERLGKPDAGRWRARVGHP